MAASANDAVIEDGVLKSLCGYTWPGIEWGEPPGPKYTFFEYMDAVRADDLARVRAIEAVDGGVWWAPTLDRGGGAPLHAAAAAGSLTVARHLLDARRAPVNQRDAVTGATPLHWAAAAAHDRDGKAARVFELLLSRGADPDARAARAADGAPGPPPTPLEAAVEKGHGWAPGQVRAELQRAVDAAAHIAKRPVVPAPPARLAPAGAALLADWSALSPPPPPPPAGWRPPPPAGWAGAQGVRRASVDGWRPAGSPGDGWVKVRAATAAELAARAAEVAAVVE